MPSSGAGHICGDRLESAPWELFSVSLLRVAGDERRGSAGHCCHCGDNCSERQSLSSCLKRVARAGQPIWKQRVSSRCIASRSNSGGATCTWERLLLGCGGEGKKTRFRTDIGIDKAKTRFDNRPQVNPGRFHADMFLSKPMNQENKARVERKSTSGEDDGGGWISLSSFN